MDGGSPSPLHPAWTDGVSRKLAAWRGARETPFVPAFILFVTFIGFGALTSETGLSWLELATPPPMPSVGAFPI
jgi:hypothetical protein